MLVFHKAAAARLCLPVVLISLTGLCSAQEPTAEEITQRLLDWQHSFATLRIVYEVRNPKQWLVRKPELANSGNIDQYFQRYEWAYSDAGKMCIHYSNLEAGVRASKIVFGTNGQVSFRAEYGADSSPDTLKVGRAPPLHEFRSITPLPLRELLSGRSEWYGEIFKRAAPIVLQTDVIDSSSCVAIDRGDFTLWLDLDHDCLPKLYEPDPGINGTRFHVEEFIQLSNGRWFPKKGTSVQTKENQPYYWVVTAAEVNKQLPDSVFAPPKPGPQTKLHDRAGYFGKAATPRILPREGKPLPPNPPPPLPTGSPVTATIPKTNWSRVIIGGMAVLILATLFGFWWNRRI